jgi:hypothetical protein
MEANNDAALTERKWLAKYVLIFSGIIILVLAFFAATRTTSNAKEIFNIVLPVVSSWVGPS